MDADLLGDLQDCGVDVMAEFDAGTGIAMAALFAMVEQKSMTAKALKAIEHSDGPSSLCRFLGAERMLGYGAGLAAALAIIDGADPKEQYEKFLSSIESTVNMAMAEAFRHQVERYSESGEG